MRFIYLLFSCLFSLFASAGVLPPAQQYRVLDDSVFKFPEEGKIYYPAENAVLKLAAAKLVHAIYELGLNWRIAESTASEDRANSIRFIPLDHEKEIPYTSMDRRFLESYIIRTGKNTRIYAAGVAGADYAIKRFLGLLGDKRKLKKVVLVDYPDFRWRGVFITFKNTPCGEPAMRSKRSKEHWLLCIEKEFDRYAAMRINLIGIRSPIFHRMDNEDIKLLERLFASARLRNIEPMPVIASKLWGIGKQSLVLNAIEGVYHQDTPFEVHGGRLVGVESNDNMIGNGEFELEDEPRWKSAGKYLAPKWKLFGEKNGKGNLNHYLGITVPGSNTPWNSLISPVHVTGKRLISVKPGGYYELGMKNRSSNGKLIKLRISVVQYDKDKKKITGLNPLITTIGAKHNWVRNWVSVFAAENANYLAIRFSPENRDDSIGTLDIDDVELHSMRGVLVNLLNNQETKPSIKSRDGETIFKEGKDYKLIAKETKEWRGKEFGDIEQSVIEVPESSNITRIKNVVVNFDTLPLQYRSIPRSKYSLASSYTYRKYYSLLRKIARLAPPFIHISMDEYAGGLNRDSRSLKLGWDNRKLFVNFANTLQALLRSNSKVALPNRDTLEGLGIKNTSLMMWDDMLNPWHNGGKVFYQVPFGGKPGATSILTNTVEDYHLNKEIVLVSWWYPGNDKFGIVRNTPTAYHDAGYSYLFSSWFQKAGVLNWFRNGGIRTALGSLAATWDGNEGGLLLASCIGWNQSSIAECSAL